MIGIVMIVIGLFVNNERDREMRGSSAQGVALDSSVCNSSFRESRTNSPGHFNSSRLMKVPPSRDLIFFWTRLVDNSSEACWNVSQLFEFLVGTVLGGLCKLASPAVGMGTQFVLFFVLI